MPFTQEAIRMLHDMRTVHPIAYERERQYEEAKANNRIEKNSFTAVVLFNGIASKCRFRKGQLVELKVRGEFLLGTVVEIFFEDHGPDGKVIARYEYLVKLDTDGLCYGVAVDDEEILRPMPEAPIIVDSLDHGPAGHMLPKINEELQAEEPLWKTLSEAMIFDDVEELVEFCPLRCQDDTEPCSICKALVSIQKECHDHHTIYQRKDPFQCIWRHNKEETRCIELRSFFEEYCCLPPEWASNLMRLVLKFAVYYGQEGTLEDGAHEIIHGEKFAAETVSFRSFLCVVAAVIHFVEKDPGLAARCGWGVAMFVEISKDKALVDCPNSTLNNQTTEVGTQTESVGGLSHTTDTHLHVPELAFDPNLSDFCSIL